MSSKTTSISLALLALTLTLTLSSAHAHCPASSIPAILNHYGLPPSIFPGNVKSFSCDLISKDSHRLSINLRGVCTVVNTLGAIKNVLKCSETISAIISPGKLTDVKGVTVQLYVKLLPWLEAVPFGGLMTITGAESSYGPFHLKFFKFTSDQGDSPAFPYLLFPNEAPKCAEVAFDDFYNAVAANTNQDIPNNKVSNFGPLLPFNPLLVA